MSILVLNQFPELYSDYSDWLSSTNEEIYLFTTTTSGHKHDNYQLVKTFDNFGTNSLVEIEALRLFKEIPYRRIIAFDEEDILRAARLREYLKIEGQNVMSALAFRDKVTMKTLAVEGGVKCPNFLKVDSMLDIYNFVEKFGLPVILKPIDGMASIDVKVIRSDEELKLIYLDGIPKGYMIEEFIEAQMYHVDGIVLNKNLIFVSSGTYSKNLLIYQNENENGNFCYLLSPEEPIHNRLVNFVTSVLNSLPTPNVTSFHCEVFHTSEDELLLCEIGSRPPGPGARLTKSIFSAYGLDIIKETTRLMCDCEYNIEYFGFKQYSAVYMLLKREGKLTKMMNTIPFNWVSEYYPRVKLGEVFSKPDSCVDIIASIVFTGESKSDLIRNYDQLAKYVDENIMWEIEHKEEGGLLEYCI